MERVMQNVGQSGSTGSEQGAETAAPAGRWTRPGWSTRGCSRRPGRDPFDEIEWDRRDAVIANERGEAVFEQRGVEVPRFWSQQATNIVVSKYFRGAVGTPEREWSVRQLISRVVDAMSAWAREQRYFASEADLQAFSDDLTHLLVLPEGLVQQPGVVQLRHREAPAAVGVLHQLGRGHARLDPDAGEDRGHALQVRLGHGHEPLEPAVVAREPGGRRHRVRPGVVHEGLRRVRGRHQVGREDAARGEDGDPQRRAPGRRGLHHLQGRRGEEGVGAHRRRLRRLVHGPGVRLGLLPELEQQRARDRRLHARGDRRRAVAHAGGEGRVAGDGHLQGPRHHAADRRGDARLRRPGHAVRHDDQRVAHVPEHGPHQRVEPVLRVHVPRRLGVQPRVDQPDEVRRRARRVRRRGLQGRRPRRSSPRRRSSSAARATRRRPSSATASTTGRSASATPTSARC